MALKKHKGHMSGLYVLRYWASATTQRLKQKKPRMVFRVGLFVDEVLTSKDFKNDNSYRLFYISPFNLLLS